MLKALLRKIQPHCEGPALWLAARLFEGGSRRRALRMARCLGALGWLLSPRSKKHAAANLKQIFGDRLSRRRCQLLIKANFRHMARMLVDFFWFSHNGHERTSQWMSMEPRMLAWLQNNKSGIVVTGHIGSWEAAGQMSAVYGFPLTSVAQQLGTPATIEKINQRRTALGQKIVMMEGAVRGLLRTLRHGGHVALVMDQHVDPALGGIWIDFLGLPATVSNAAAKLSKKLNVPVAVCFGQALPNGRYYGRLIEECLPQREETVEAMTQRIADALGNIIRRHPTQWLLRYRRWKYWPDNADPEIFPFYAKPWNE